ncbi:MAG: Gfo/Idh/MocA family oxidoreductase, partial [Clostridia bacterium]|nr:Gfo/Idh/MocA family oxidoreductase [Clostridia bacterium]
MKKIKIGFVGVGAISGIYLENITNMFKEIEIIGVCDLIRERAENAVKKYNIPKLYNDMYELFADPEVDIVLNITRPYEHYEVTKATLNAGKHVYCEKPLGASLEEGKELVALAKEKGLLLGGAPDTYLGAGIQTCRKIIEDGVIGDIVGCGGWLVCHGHESWHPDPEFYYKYGGGPMFDMGPYY